MSDFRKFVYSPMQKPAAIQPQCPVYIHGYVLARQKYGEAAFVQIRMVNRGDRSVRSVFLRIEGKDPFGNSLYDLQYVPVLDCGGDSGRIFGEEQPLFLPQGDVSTLDISVLDILFEDGMIWRKQSGHALMTAEEAGWVTCSCGMKNPAGHPCAYCGMEVEQTATLPVEEPAVSQEEPTEEMPAVMQESSVEEPAIMQESPVEEPAAEIPVIEESVAVISEDESESEVTTTSEQLPCEEDMIFPDIPMYEERELTAEEEEDLAKLLASVLGDVDESLWEENSTDEFQQLEQLEAYLREDKEAYVDRSRNGIGTITSPFMQETELILQEMQRRLNARENREDEPAQQAEKTTANAEPATPKSKKKKNRGSAFWIVLICLLIVLGSAAFFGILYAKGYIG